MDILEQGGPWQQPVLGAFYLHLTYSVDVWRESAQEKEGKGREGALAPTYQAVEK